MRTELINQLAETINNLPCGFHQDIFGGGYAKSMGYVHSQCWGNASWATHVVFSMVDSFKLQRGETFELANQCTELEEYERKMIRGVASGFLVYCMGSYVPMYKNGVAQY